MHSRNFLINDWYPSLCHTDVEGICLSPTEICLTKLVLRVADRPGIQSSIITSSFSLVAERIGLTFFAATTSGDSSLVSEDEVNYLSASLNDSCILPSLCLSVFSNTFW